MESVADSLAFRYFVNLHVSRPVSCNTLSALLTHTLRNDSSDVSGTLRSDVPHWPAAATALVKVRSGQTKVSTMIRAATTWLAVLSVLLLSVRDSASLFLPDSKELRQLLSRYEEDADQNGTSNAAGGRSRRDIRWSDREEILQLHNKLRSGVYPTASNMEHMVRHRYLRGPFRTHSQ